MLPPFLLVPTGAGGMAGGGRGAPCHLLGRGVLDFSQWGYLPPGGGVASDFCHPVVGVVAPQPGHLQWSPPADAEIVHDARGFALSWHQGGIGPLYHVAL